MSKKKDRDKKRRRAEKAEAEVRERQEVFDVFRLLREENTETKPNMGKFLKQYVKDVRAVVVGLASFYPSFSFKTTRVFVMFLDGHELMYDPAKLKAEEKYVSTYGF